MSPRKTPEKKSRTILQVGIAVIIGVATGFIWGGRVQPLGELGLLLIRFLKALATPLVFFAIVDTLCKTKIKKQSAAKLLSLSLVNAFVAGTIAYFVSSLFGVQGGAYLAGMTSQESLTSPIQNATQVKETTIAEKVSEYIPQNIFEPIINNNVISVILLAVMVGVTLRKLRDSAEYKAEALVLEKFTEAGLRLFTTMLGTIVKLIPFAVFGVVASRVGMSGSGFFSSLGFFLVLVGLAMALHVGVYYSVVLIWVLKISPRQFFTDSGEAVATAFGTGSSLATLPVTLGTLQEKMKVSATSARLAACIGTNLNHVGILLYEVMAALFVAEVSGIHLSFFQKIALMGSSMIAAVGIAGVPEAGLITLSLVLTSAGLPLTLIPILMTVDWIVGRLRAAVNVLSDIMVALLLDFWETKRLDN